MVDNKLAKIVSAIFSIDPKMVDSNLSIETCESWDSMNHMNLILALEQEYGVKINDDHAVDLISIPLIVEYLSKNQRK